MGRPKQDKPVMLPVLGSSIYPSLAIAGGLLGKIITEKCPETRKNNGREKSYKTNRLFRTLKAGDTRDVPAHLPTDGL